MTYVLRITHYVFALATVIGWLGLWHLASNAADGFASATAFAGLVGWALSVSGMRNAERRTRNELHPRLFRIPHSAFRILLTAGYILLGLAVAASLSLGAFLPAGFAEWASPALGRFGGPLALTLISVGLITAVAAGLVAKRQGAALDAAMACGLAAFWVGSQVERQATFPTPPTTASLLASRFDILFILGTILALASVLAWLAKQRASEQLKTQNHALERSEGSKLKILHGG